MRERWVFDFEICLEFLNSSGCSLLGRFVCFPLKPHLFKFSNCWGKVFEAECITWLYSALLCSTSSFQNSLDFILSLLTNKLFHSTVSTFIIVYVLWSSALGRKVKDFSLFSLFYFKEKIFITIMSRVGIRSLWDSSLFFDSKLILRIKNFFL